MSPEGRETSTATPYDALFFVSFGGPEKESDVMPFLERVVAGRNVPRARLERVAEHYYHFDGKSPINDANRALIAALRTELEAKQIDLPIVWGNRNWHPTLDEALTQMKEQGMQRVLAFVTSAFSSFSGCRQYREAIGLARQRVGQGAPKVDKLRVLYNHPGFIEAMADRVRAAYSELKEDQRTAAPLIFTAHSIPHGMAKGCDYEQQLQEACRLVAEQLKTEPLAAEDNAPPSWSLAYQSRSGPPTQPWLEPDILDALGAPQTQAAGAVVVAPIGFIADHMEVVWDLDHEAQERAQELGLTLARAKTVGTHPAFVAAIVELIEERLGSAAPRAIGRYGPSHDVCPADCCLYPRPSA